MNKFYFLVVVLAFQTVFAEGQIGTQDSPWGRESNGAGGAILKSKRDLTNGARSFMLRMKNPNLVQPPLEKEIRSSESFVISEAPMESGPIAGGYIVGGFLAASTDFYPGAPTYINADVLKTMSSAQIQEMLLQMALYRSLPDSLRSVDIVEKLSVALMQPSSEQIRGEAWSFLTPMPKNSPPLANSEIEEISKWIQSGAN